MQKKIKQLRFDNSNSSEITFTNGWSNNLIETLGPVIQLGIYALPGTRFKINQAQSYGEIEELIINGYGLFSIDLENKPITTISLHQESYNNSKENNHFIIIDLIYIPKGVEDNA